MWTDDVEKEVKEFKESLQKNGRQEMKINQNHLFLFSTIVLLGLGVLFAFKIKTDQLNQSNSIVNNKEWVDAPNLITPKSPQTNISSLDDLKKQYEAIDLAAQKIWERTKWNSERMTLLATLNNHNLLVLANGHPKSELIFINPDWTINRLPDRIKLDSADIEFMKKFLRQ